MESCMEHFRPMRRIRQEILRSVIAFGKARMHQCPWILGDTDRPGIDMLCSQTFRITHLICRHSGVRARCSRNNSNNHKIQ